MGEAKNIYFTCLNFIRFIKLSISSSSIIHPSLISPKWETVRATTVESRDISLGNVLNRVLEVVVVVEAEPATTATRRVTFPVTAPWGVVAAAAVVGTVTTVTNPAIFLVTVPNLAAEVADLAVVVVVVVVEIATIAVNLATCLAIALNPDLEVDVPTNSATSAKDTATFPVTALRRTGIRDAMARFAHRAHHHLSRHQVFHFYGQFVETHF